MFSICFVNFRYSFIDFSYSLVNFSFGFIDFSYCLVNFRYCFVNFSYYFMLQLSFSFFSMNSRAHFVQLFSTFLPLARINLWLS